jgi:hypothetical protein
MLLFSFSAPSTTRCRIRMPQGFSLEHEPFISCTAPRKPWCPDRLCYGPWTYLHCEEARLSLCEGCKAKVTRFQRRGDSTRGARSVTAQYCLHLACSLVQLAVPGSLCATAVPCQSRLQCGGFFCRGRFWSPLALPSLAAFSLRILSNAKAVCKPSLPAAMSWCSKASPLRPEASHLSGHARALHTGRQKDDEETTMGGRHYSRHQRRAKKKGRKK